MSIQAADVLENGSELTIDANSSKVYKISSNINNGIYKINSTNSDFSFSDLDGNNLSSIAISNDDPYYVKMQWPNAHYLAQGYVAGGHDQR